MQNVEWIICPMDAFWSALHNNKYQTVFYIPDWRVILSLIHISHQTEQWTKYIRILECLFG